MSPVASFGFLLAPRERTLPRTPITHSRRASEASALASVRRRASSAEPGPGRGSRPPRACSPIAEIDEDALAVIAVARDPAEQHDLAPLVGGAKLARAVGAFELVDESGHEKDSFLEKGRRNWTLGGPVGQEGPPYYG